MDALETLKILAEVVLSGLRLVGPYAAAGLVLGCLMRTPWRAYLVGLLVTVLTAAVGTGWWAAQQRETTTELFLVTVFGIAAFAALPGLLAGWIASRVARWRGRKE